MGDVVLVSGAHVHIGSWPLGVVEQVNTSSDGLVRTAVIRAADGTLTRGVRYIILLEVKAAGRKAFVSV